MHKKWKRDKKRKEKKEETEGRGSLNPMSQGGQTPLVMMQQHAAECGCCDKLE